MLSLPDALPICQFVGELAALNREAVAVGHEAIDEIRIVGFDRIVKLRRLTGQRKERGIGRTPALVREIEALHKIRETVARRRQRSEEHTSELQSLMRISYAVFCLKNKKT